jgi:hypothetical protein
MRRFALALVLAALALAPAQARADGDPASDVLPSEDVYYGVELLNTQSEQAAQLPALLAAARTKGFDMKVAVLTQDYDMGSVSVLWRKPQPYAQFLGEELKGLYPGRILIVMPNGFGIYHGGASVASETKALAGLTPPAAAGAALSASIKAVRAVAAGQGIPLTVPQVAPAAPPAPPTIHSLVKPAATASPADKGGGGLGSLLPFLFGGVAVVLGVAYFVSGRRS